MHGINKVIEVWSRVKQCKDGLNAKKAIFEEAVNDPRTNQYMQEFLTYMMDDYRTYGISIDYDRVQREGIYQFDYHDDSEGNSSWRQFKEMLDLLNNRQVTGDMAREVVYAFMMSLPRMLRYGFTVVINRGETIGLGEGTFFKYFPNFIKTYAPMKCDTYEWEGLGCCDWIAEDKFDGFRMQVWKNPGKPPIALSSAGKVLHNCEAILAKFDREEYDGWIFDGEIISSAFAKVSSIVTTITPHPKRDTLIFECFDSLTIDEWMAGCSPRRLRDRKANLYAQLDPILNHQIHFVRSRRFRYDDETCLRAIFDEALHRGLEGIIVKDLDSVYDCDRSDAWLKIKPADPVDLVIADFSYGEDNRLHGIVNSVRIVGESVVKRTGRTYKFDSWMGSGLSDETRSEMTNMAHEGTLIGRCVEVIIGTPTNEVGVECDGDGVTSIRFPRFNRWRPDKKMEIPEWVQ